MFANHMARAKRVVSYPSFTVVPVQGFNVAITSGAGAATVTSSALRESNGTTASSSLSAYVFAEVMHTPLFTVTIGNARIGAVTSSRGIGGGMFSDDGTRGVFFIMAGNTTPCRIYTYESGTATIRGTTSNQFTTSSSDLIQLRPSISSGVVTWNIYRNGVLMNANWTDNTHIMDLPGRRFGACFRHEYSGGHFPSPGIKSVEAADI